MPLSFHVNFSFSGPMVLKKTFKLPHLIFTFCDICAHTRLRHKILIQCEPWIISPLKRTCPFIIRSLNTLYMYPRIICTQFDWVWPCFWRKIKKKLIVFLLFCHYLPLERGITFHLNELETLHRVSKMILPCSFKTGPLVQEKKWCEKFTERQ
jgi:hypothetical protein